MSNLLTIAAVGAFIFDDQNRIFLAKFAEKFEKKWSIPGGKIDFGETPIKACVREIKEETNIELKENDLKFFEHGSFSVGNHHVVYMDYLAKLPQESEIKINEEFTQWGFYSRSQLEEMDIIPKTKSTILTAMRYLNRQSLSLSFAKFNLGLIRKTIHHQKHQANWGEAFEMIKNMVLPRLNHLGGYKIQHIGSTSVEHLIAKPVLDLLLTFEDEQIFKEDILKIEELGFTYKGDAVGKVNQEVRDEKRHFFSFYNNAENIDYIHLHAMHENHAHGKDMIQLRDLLRSKKSLIHEYENLKENLRLRGNTRGDYTRLKTDFVKNALKTS